MKRICSIVFLLFSLSSIIFCSDLAPIFDKAKVKYFQGNYAEAFFLVQQIEDQLILLNEMQEDIEQKNISVEKINTFPDEYLKQNYIYKIENAVLNPHKVVKDEDFNKYLIEVSNKSRTTVIEIDSKKKGRFVFLIDFSLLEQIIDLIGEDEICLANIYIDHISEMSTTSFFYSDKYYYAEIKNIELLSDNDEVRIIP